MKGGHSKPIVWVAEIGMTRQECQEDSLNLSWHGQWTGIKAIPFSVSMCLPSPGSNFGLFFATYAGALRAPALSIESGKLYQMKSLVLESKRVFPVCASRTQGFSKRGRGRRPRPSPLILNWIYQVFWAIGCIKTGLGNCRQRKAKTDSPSNVCGERRPPVEGDSCSAR